MHRKAHHFTVFSTLCCQPHLCHVLRYKSNFPTMLACSWFCSSGSQLEGNFFLGGMEEFLKHTCHTVNIPYMNYI